MASYALVCLHTQDSDGGIASPRLDSPLQLITRCLRSVQLGCLHQCCRTSNRQGELPAQPTQRLWTVASPAPVASLHLAHGLLPIFLQALQTVSATQPFSISPALDCSMRCLAWKFEAVEGSCRDPVCQLPFSCATRYWLLNADIYIPYLRAPCKLCSERVRLRPIATCLTVSWLTAGYFLWTRRRCRGHLQLWTQLCKHSGPASHSKYCKYNRLE